MSDETVANRAAEALAEFLIERDAPGSRVGPLTRYEYHCRAAAIINGEVWAIRKTWPDTIRALLDDLS